MEGNKNEKIETDDETRRRRSSSRRMRVVAAAVVIIVVAIVIAFWGSQPERTYTPSDILSNPQQFVGKTVQVRGLAMSLDALNKTFVLGDFIVNLTVQYSFLPEAFEIEKEMIVKGVLQVKDGGWVLVAQDVTVGHPK